MKQIIRKTLAIILIVVFAATPLQADFFYLSRNVLAEDEPESLEDLYITENTAWNNDTDLSPYLNIYVEYGATLTIEKGTELAFRHLYIYGNIVAIGTGEEKIKLTKIPSPVIEAGDWDPLCFAEPMGTIELSGPADYDEDPESIFEFVEFSEMGGFYEFDTENCPGLSRHKIRNIFFSAAYAAPAKTVAPAATVYSGKIRMKNCDFKNNAYEDVRVEMEYGSDWNQQSYVYIENSNFQNNSQNTAVTSSVIKPDVYTSLFEGCFSECRSHYPDDYRIYGQICTEYCRNSARSDPNFHDKTKVVLKNNWYGDAHGPSGEFGTTNLGEKVSGDATLDLLDWRGSADFASNVLFLPGIKASRLDSADDDDQAWLPENGSDVDKLLMDKNGESIHDIYAKNIVENAYAISGIYDEFVEDLSMMKYNKIIKDYSLFAYDWRMDVEDIAKNGTKYKDEIKKAASEIERLQKTSTSQKITIVSHSNGGLLAKAIMQELEKQDQSEWVDSIIMVSSPQMGTPETVPALLHGYDQALPYFSRFVDEADGRELAENMPGAYGLLPSEEYFKRNQESIIDFKTDLDPYKKYKDAYGEKIDSFEEFRKFLLAKDDEREKPSRDDLKNANVLNEKLFDEAREMRDRIDNWSPPESVKLIQIGGWGLDTISGMEYAQKSHVECAKTLFIPQCTETSLFDPIMEPKFTSEGDGAVTTPSSLMLSNSDRVERYWMDLHKYNKSFSSIINRNHGDILELENINSFLSTIIKTHQSPEVLPQYISSLKPDDYKNMKPRIRMSLYSPLDIHLYDENGNHTGPITKTVDGEETITIEENIPNSYYKIFGEQKYVGWGTGDDVRVELHGYGEGSYTVRLQEISLTEDGEEEGDFTSFENLPTIDGTKVDFSIPSDGLKEMTLLQADYDGDGENDYEVVPKINSSATLESEEEETQDESNEESIVNNDDDEEKKEKAKIDSWKASLFAKNLDKICQQRLKLEIKGKRFDDKTEIFIGNQKAKRIDKKSSRKVEAIFCLNKLLKKKTSLKRSVSTKNPGADKSYANKNIDLGNFIKY